MDFERQAAEFRSAVALAGPRGRTTAYPTDLRERAVRYVRARIEQGGTMVAACEELGIGTDTFRRWRAAGSAATAPVTAAFRAVTITAPATPPVETPLLVVHAPGGLRIEGLDLPSLAELLRRLG